MKKNLDLKDRKILYELDVNSRQSNAQIAKNTGISKQLVGFRINRLIKNKVITSFFSVIDISKLGFTIHKIFLRLQNLNRSKEKELINFLINHPDVVWVSGCDGKFDMAFGTWARNMEFLDRTLSELNEKFGEHISEKQIATIIRGEYFIRDYLVSKKEPSSYRESFFGSVPSKTEIDRYDWKILFLLGKNSRKRIVDISKEINLGVDAVINRIRRLEKSGIIKHYNFVPNEESYPYLHYKVLMRFRNISEAKEKSIKEYCRRNPNIVYMVKSLGPWELEIDIEVESTEQFREIMMDIKTRFSNIIKDYSSLHIYKVYKYDFCPSIRIEE